MSRFFKSAAFPILIVVVLAFFAQKLISPGSPSRDTSFADFQTQLADGQLKDVTVKQKDNTLEVKRKDNETYTVGWPQAYGAELINDLSSAKTAGKIDDFNAKGNTSNG